LFVIVKSCYNIWRCTDTTDTNRIHWCSVNLSGEWQSESHCVLALQRTASRHWFV